MAVARSRRRSWKACWRLKHAVTVVAPEINPAMEKPGVTLHRRQFEPADLDGMWWVVAAAPPDVNRDVQAAAETRRLFVNAVDDPAHATAYLGGVVRRDDVTIAISTGGRAPALAGLLREGAGCLASAGHRPLDGDRGSGSGLLERGRRSDGAAPPDAAGSIESVVRKEMKNNFQLPIPNSQVGIGLFGSWELEVGR